VGYNTEQLGRELCCILHYSCVLFSLFFIENMCESVFNFAKLWVSGPLCRVFSFRLSTLMCIRWIRAAGTTVCVFSCSFHSYLCASRVSSPSENCPFNHPLFKHFQKSLHVRHLWPSLPTPRGAKGRGTVRGKR